MRTEDLRMWAQWMHAAGMSAETIRTRTGQIVTLSHHAGLSDPKQVTTKHLIAWLADCDTAWTRRTYWSSARAWCGWLTLMGERADNPLSALPRPRVPRGLPRPVDDSVIDRLLHEPQGARAHAYVVLAVFAGLRVHEIAKIRGEDLDMQTQWLYVDGKGGQVAGMPAHPGVMRLAWGFPRSGFWFPGADRGHVRADSVSRTVSTALRRAGSQATPHQLRHSFGTAVLRSARDLRVAQELLRHESAASTQIYTQVRHSDMRAAIRGLPWSA